MSCIVVAVRELQGPVTNQPRTNFFIMFFFLIRRLPRRSTLFPYTTLFRSSERSAPVTEMPRRRSRSVTSAAAVARSEEHTSELQSLTNLVCRLLLEKKKNFRPSSVPLESLYGAGGARRCRTIPRTTSCLLL